MTKENRTPFYKGKSVEYETESDIELTITLSCANGNCKNTTRVRLMKGGSATGAYHNKKYGCFDIRNIGFVCDECQQAYDEWYVKSGYDKVYGLMKLNRSLA